MKQSCFDTHQQFSYNDLEALKMFYAGVPARSIRVNYPDIWQLLSRHRAMPKDQYEAVKTALEDIHIDNTNG